MFCFCNPACLPFSLERVTLQTHLFVSAICCFHSYHPSCHHFHSNFSDRKTGICKKKKKKKDFKLQWSAAAVLPTSPLSVGLLVSSSLFCARSFQCLYRSDRVSPGFHSSVSQIQTNLRNLVKN